MPLLPLLLFSLLLAVAGCTDRVRPDPLDPVDAVLALSGVEHVVAVETARLGAGRISVLLRSTLSNRGDDAVTLRVRPCLGRADIRGEDSEPWFSALVPGSRQPPVRRQRLQLWITTSLPRCTEAEEEITLAPGASSDTLVVLGSAPYHPGRAPPMWQLRIRHALEPEQWTPVIVEVPRRR